MCTILCTGFYPQDGNGNLSPYLPISCDNQKYLTTLPNVPWDAKLSPVENRWLSVFVIYCCVTNDPPNLVTQNKNIYYLIVTMGQIFESDLVGGSGSTFLMWLKSKCLHHLNAWLGLEKLLPRWLNHMEIGRRLRSLLLFGRIFYSLSCGHLIKLPDMSSWHGNCLPQSKWSERE